MMTRNGQVDEQGAELFAELEQLRMERDWTYSQLGANIFAVTQRRRADDCWRRICQGKTKEPHGRTRDILMKYLDSVRAPRARRRRVS